MKCYGILKGGTNPLFLFKMTTEILNKEDWIDYKKQVENSLKIQTMAVLSDTALLEYIKSVISTFKNAKP